MRKYLIKLENSIKFHHEVFDWLLCYNTIIENNIIRLLCVIISLCIVSV